MDLKFTISRVVCDVWDDCEDCDEEVVVWEFTGVAVAVRTGWTEILGVGFDGFGFTESVWAEFITLFLPEDEEALVDDVTTTEEVEDAEEVDDEACPWLWLIPDTELVKVEVDGIFEFPLLVWN